jgi:hypothetical protein
MTAERGSLPPIQQMYSALDQHEHQTFSVSAMRVSNKVCLCRLALLDGLPTDFHDIAGD